MVIVILSILFRPLLLICRPGHKPGPGVTVGDTQDAGSSPASFGSVLYCELFPAFPRASAAVQPRRHGPGGGYRVKTGRSRGAGLLPYHRAVRHVALVAAGNIQHEVPLAAA